MKTKFYQIANWLVVPSHIRLLVCLVFFMLLATAVLLPGMHAIADGLAGGGGH